MAGQSAAMKSRSVIGDSPKRREDARFITGRGAYIDDLPFERLARAAGEAERFVRQHIKGDGLAFALKDRSAAGGQCRRCQSQTVLMAELPERIVEKGLASDRVVVETVVSKYCDHLPLYRQEAILAREAGIVVNGTPENRPGRKLHDGDIVVFEGRSITVEDVRPS